MKYFAKYLNQEVLLAKNVAKYLQTSANVRCKEVAVAGHKESKAFKSPGAISRQECVVEAAGKTNTPDVWGGIKARQPDGGNGAERRIWRLQIQQPTTRQVV